MTNPVWMVLMMLFSATPSSGQSRDSDENHQLTYRAKRNDKGHLVPDASEDVIQKSQGFENYQLARREGKPVVA